MTPKRMKHSDVTPVRAFLVKKQKVCPLCKEKFGASKKPALDHDHVTGYIRDALCLNCNGMEGKIFNRANRAKSKLTVQQWLGNLLEYYERHREPQHGGILHPTHKTEAEKRLLRNKRARQARASKKG